MNEDNKNTEHNNQGSQFGVGREVPPIQSVGDASQNRDFSPHPSSDMVVAHHGSHRFGGRRKLWIIIAIIVAIALAGTGGVIIMNGGFGGSGSDKSNDGSSAATSGSSTDGQSSGNRMTTDQLSTAINNLYSKQDYAAAAKLAEAQVDQDNPQSLLILAAAYTNTQQYPKAFAIYDKLDGKNQLGGSDTMTAGEVAQLAGDKARAKTYFEKAKVRVQAEKQDFSTQRELSFIDEQLAGL